MVCEISKDTIVGFILNVIIRNFFYSKSSACNAQIVGQISHNRDPWNSGKAVTFRIFKKIYTINIPDISEILLARSILLLKKDNIHGLLFSKLGTMFTNESK